MTTHLLPAHTWFALERDTDPGGISGTGRVAYPLALPSGVFMAWDTGWPTAELLPDLQTVVEIHGHHGASRLVPIHRDADAIDRAADLITAQAVTLRHLLAELAALGLVGSRP